MLENLTYDELQEIDGGLITITILGETLTGGKGVTAIVGGVTVIGGVAGLGFYLGYK